MASTLIFGDIPRDYRPDKYGDHEPTTDPYGLRIPANLRHLYLDNELVRLHLGMNHARFAAIVDKLDLNRRTNPYLLAAARSIVETLGNPSFIFVREADLVREKSDPAHPVTPEIQALDDRICLLLQLLQERSNPEAYVLDDRLRPSVSSLSGISAMVRRPRYQTAGVS